MRQELRKVSWSDRPALRRNVAVVLVVLLAVVALIFVLDLVLGWAVTELYSG